MRVRATHEPAIGPLLTCLAKVRMSGLRGGAKAVRKVAAGERFVSPRLAEATTFAGAAIKASPLTQMAGAGSLSARRGALSQ